MGGLLGGGGQRVCRPPPKLLGGGGRLPPPSPYAYARSKKVPIHEVSCIAMATAEDVSDQF